MVVTGEPLVTRTVRTLLLLALAAAALAMVAPAPDFQIGTGFLPGFCTTSYDLDGWATLDCTPGIIKSTVDPLSSTGIAQPARIYVAAAIAAVLVAIRRERGRTDAPTTRSVLLLRVALAATVAGVVLGGLAAPGRLALLAAAVLLALALRAWGALPRSAGVPIRAAES